MKGSTGISLIKVLSKVGKSDNSVCRKGSKGLTDAFFDFKKIEKITHVFKTMDLQ